MSGTGTAAKTNTLALVAFITAFVIPLAGLAIAVVARRQLDAPGNTESGRGFARWAMVIGVLGVSVSGVFLSIWLWMLSVGLSNLAMTA